MATKQMPTEDQMNGFMGITQTNRADAIRILQKHNNNVESAIGAFFDGDNAEPESEMPALTAAEGFGELPYDKNPAITVHAPDELPAYKSFDGALSRPPSRTTNNRSPHGVIDLTDDPASANVNAMTGWSNEDEELQRAIKLSLGQEVAQQSGTISKVFGPATREQSEYQDGWDMVPYSANKNNWEDGPTAKASTQEILLDPDAIYRKRDLQTPAFLRPSIASDHRLGALITIYHEIPIIREIFLNRIDSNGEYGSNAEWWSGTPIELPPMAIEQERLTKLQFTYELQRLMAFLDKTTRSYGSTEALEKLDAVRSIYSTAEGMESVVLEAFSKTFRGQQAVVGKLFCRAEVPSQGGWDPQLFGLLPLAIPAEDSFDDTIYDMADAALWQDSLELEDMPFLSHVSDVITFRITKDHKSRDRPVDIPLTWYADRYLESGREAALKMRKEKEAVKESWHVVSQAEKTLTTQRVRVGNTIKELNFRDLFKISLRHNEQGSVEDTGIELFDKFVRSQSGDDLESSVEPELEPPSYDDQPLIDISAELRSLEERIDAKLLAINEIKEKVINDMRELSKLYTEQSSEPGSPKLHRYTLRGVSTSKNTMYVCRQAEPDLIDMDIAADEPYSPTGEQWWRINFVPFGAYQVTVEKTTRDKVLEAAKTETKTPLLVYASDKAMQWKTKPLPAALEAFVQHDNQLFAAELNESIPHSPVDTQPSPKRKSGEISSDDSEEDRWSVASNKRSSAEPGRYDDNFNSTIVTNGDVIHGVDPSLPESSPSQEMQEKASTGIRLLSGRLKDVTDANTIDAMDLDQVVEDNHVVEESKAVRHVGFAD